jgi:hypothetical protein
MTAYRTGVKCFERVSSSCSTNGTRRVTLVANPVICHPWANDQYYLGINLHSVTISSYLY